MNSQQETEMVNSQQETEMMEDEKIVAFAADLYMYLVPWRMGVPHIPARLPIPNEKTPYTDDIGKAILITCYFQQQKFCEYFLRDYGIFTEDLGAFFRYCTSTGIAMFRARHDVFESLFLVSAMILELVAFCHVRSFKVHFWYADCCWAMIFRFHFKDIFFKSGGWQPFKERAQYKSKMYIFEEHEVYPGQCRKSHLWLTRFDREMVMLPPAESTITSVKDCKVTKQTIGQEPKLEGISQVNELCEQFERITLEVGADDLDSSSAVKAPSSVKGDVTNLSYLSEATKPAKDLGPKPEIMALKHSKKSSKNAHFDNTELLKSFSNIMKCNDHGPGQNLYKILINEENLKSLMNDMSFMILVRRTVKTPENRPCNKQLLDYARKIIYPFDTRHNQQVDDFLSQIDSTIDEKHNIKKFDSSEKKYNQKELFEGGAIFLPVPEFLDSNKVAAMGLNTRNGHEKCSEIENSKYVCASEEQILEMSKTIENMKVESDGITSNFVHTANFFQKTSYSKNFYNYTKEQTIIEHFLSVAYFKTFKNAEILDKILDPLEYLDLLARQYRKIPKLETHASASDLWFKFIQRNRRNLTSELIRKYLVINRCQNKNLSKMPNLYQTKYGCPENGDIHARMEDNFRKNQNALEAREKIASDVLFSCNMDEISAFKRVENNSALAVEIKLEAEMGKCVGMMQKEDDDLINQNMRKSLTELLIAHVKTVELLEHLFIVLDLPEKIVAASRVATQRAAAIAQSFQEPVMQIIKNIEKKFQETSLGLSSVGHHPKQKFQETSLGLSHKISVPHAPPIRPPRGLASSNKVPPNGSKKSYSCKSFERNARKKDSNKRDAPKRDSPSSKTTLFPSSTKPHLTENSLQNPAASSKAKLSKSLDDCEKGDNISSFQREERNAIYSDLSQEETTSSEEYFRSPGSPESPEELCFKNETLDCSDKSVLQPTRLSPLREFDEKAFVSLSKKKGKKKRKK